MVTANVAPAVGSKSADVTPARMRSQLDRQRTALLQEGRPAYDTRIDRTKRLIVLLVEIKMGLLVRLMLTMVTAARRLR